MGKKKLVEQRGKFFPNVDRLLETPNNHFPNQTEEQMDLFGEVSLCLLIYDVVSITRHRLKLELPLIFLNLIK